MKRRWSARATLGLLISASAACALHSPASRAASLTFTSTPTSAAAPHGYWLGLNGNSASNPYTHEPQGPVAQFARYGIVYDRSFEIYAGALPSETERDSSGGTLFEDKLQLDHRYGMIPVSTIEYRGYHGNFSSDPYLPKEARTGAEAAEGKTTIAQYVAGFVSTASAILGLIRREDPRMPVLFEPMNEPWGYTTPMFNGAQYAHVIAKLLPAAQAAGIPLTDIYVAAIGTDQQLNEQGEAEAFAPGWIPAMYAAEPSLHSEIQGWYFHPYGPPSGIEAEDDLGIQSIPEVRKRMTSGQDNIIVSEIGYCASQQGGDCHESGQAEVETRAEAAAQLTAMLENALPYRQAGWLRALIVYGRGDGGWAMVDPNTRQLDAQGEALEEFAFAHGGGEETAQDCTEASLFSFNPGAVAPIAGDFLERPFDEVAGCSAGHRPANTTIP